MIWERDQGWFTTEPFSELEVFDFPAGHRTVECVNVEHEEVLLVPRWVDAERVTFKYGLGEEFIWVLKTLHKLGLDSTSPVTVGTPRSRRATWWRPACPTRPSSATDARGHLCRHVGDRDRASTAAPRGLPAPRRRQRLDDGRVRLAGRGVADGGEPRRGARARGLGAWSGAGVLGPEAFPADPFLELLVEHGAPWALDERTPGRR